MNEDSLLPACASQETIAANAHQPANSAAFHLVRCGISGIGRQALQLRRGADKAYCQGRTDSAREPRKAFADSEYCEGVTSLGGQFCLGVQTSEMPRFEDTPAGQGERRGAQRDARLSGRIP